jgi:hypothetical protein
MAGITTFFFMTTLSRKTKRLFQGTVLPVVGETVGIVGTGELDATMGGTLGAGTGTAALTPRLPIS